MSIYEVMKEKNIVLPPAPPKGGLYTQAMPFGEKLVYISGCGSDIKYAEETGLPAQAIKGKLGKEVSIAEGQQCARNAMLNLLAVVDANCGLENVKRFVKILAFVGSDADFYDQPAVANGGSQVLVDLFGEAPSRSAVGMVSLPGNQPVEIEALIELK